ncbi:MAG TPA: O-antigen polymerase [Cyclobacteriaceae bacterium]|nr:O-antigen polymerase [Cyclobacteriaceae bacterium]
MLSFEENVYVLSMLVISVTILVKNYRQRNPLEFWSPLTVISLIYFYYVLVGPLLAIRNNETYFRFIDHREYVVYAWRISFIGLIGIISGFTLGRKKTIYNHVESEIHSEKDNVKKNGFRLFLIGLLGLTIFSGLGGVINKVSFWDINAFARPGYEGAFRNYFLHAIDFFIPAIVILFIYVIKRKFSVFWFLVFLFLALAVYTKEGFRWRYVVLGLSLMITYYCVVHKKPGLILITVIIISGIAFMGFLGLTRNYGRGLDLTSITGKSNTEIFLEGFGESSIFMTTGLLVKDVPELFDHINFDPLIQTIAMPVPRMIWPGKPSGDYIEIYENLYGSKQFGYGTAVINFGEYYLSFGYIGVFVGGFLIGFFYRKIWDWFRRRPNDEAAIAFYAIAISYLYVIISRGYLPQVTMLFFFAVFPAYIIYWLNRNRSTAESSPTFR